MTDSTENAAEATRTIRGTEYERYFALQAIDAKGEDSIAAARSKRKLLARASKGINWQAVSATGLAPDKHAEPFEAVVNVQQAKDWLAAIHGYFIGKQFSIQRALLPIVDQLEAFVEGRPAPEPETEEAASPGVAP